MGLELLHCSGVNRKIVGFTEAGRWDAPVLHVEERHLLSHGGIYFVYGSYVSN